MSFTLEKFIEVGKYNGLNALLHLSDAGVDLDDINIGKFEKIVKNSISNDSLAYFDTKTNTAVNPIYEIIASDPMR